MNINFVGTPKTLKRFGDLNLGDTFKICSERSTGSVYLKTKSHDGEYKMLDFGTFILFPPTPSNVEEVSVDCTINN